MEENTLPTRTPGLSRRSLVTTAAWSAPVIAVAAATPTAAASTSADVDVYLLPPNAGDVVSFYSPDYQTSYSYSSFIGFGIANSGSEDAPAGSIVQITYDPRVFAYNEAPTVRVGDAEHELAYEVTQTAPDSATLTLTVDVPIPAGASYESGTAPSVSTHQSFLLFYPDDTVENPQPYSDIVTNDADSNADNNARGPFPPTAHSTGPYTFTLDVDTTSASTSRCSMTLPQTVSITNSGYGAPADNDPMVQLDVDNTAVTDVSVTSIEIDGAAVGSYTLEPPTDDSSSWWLRVSQPIPVGSTLTVVFDYTVDADAGHDPVSSGYAAVQARIANDFANYSYDFWAYRGESFPRVDYPNTSCQL